MNAKGIWLRRYWVGALIGVAAVLLAACAGEEATPTPTTAPPTPTATPVVTEATPTPVVAEATPTLVVGEQPKYGGTLNLWCRREPSSYDIMSYGGVDWNCRYGSVVEGLVLTDMETNSIAEPALAESWEVSEDGRTWTFYLRKGVKWHDGVPLTAEDMVYGYTRFFNPPDYTTSPRNGGLASFERVYATDDYTVVFEFGATEVEVLPFFAYSRDRVLSKHQLEPIDQAGGPDVSPYLIGTGSFKVTLHRRESLTALERNPDYWREDELGNQLPYIDNIRVASGRSRATMLAAFRTRRIDITAPGSGMRASPSMVDIIHEARPDTTAQWEIGNDYTFWMHVQKEPWTDIRVRKAVLIGIDRQFFCEVAGEGQCFYFVYIPTGLYGSLPKDEVMAMPGWRQPKDQDVAEAKRLLAEAGYPNGFTIKVPVRDGQIDGAEPLVFELDKLGIEAELIIMDSITWEAHVISGEHVATLSIRGTAKQPGIITARASSDLKSFSGREIGYIRDDKVDEMLETQASTVDPVAREKILQDLWRYLIDQAYYVPIMSASEAIISSGDVKNWTYQYSHYNMQHTNTWLER